MPEESPIWIERTDIGASVSYYGFALAGTESSEAGWLIKRITRSGDDAIEAFASTRPNKVWDNRGSLSYS